MGYLPLIIVAAILVLTEVLISIKRNFIQCLIRAGAHLIATIAAFFLAKPVVAGLLSLAQKTIEPQLSQGMDEVSTVQFLGLFKIVSPMLSAFIAPFTFISIWIFTGIIMFIIYKVVSHAVTPKNDDKKRTGLDRLLAALVSVVIGIGLAFVLLMPISGTIEVVKDTMNTLDESGMLDKAAEEAKSGDDLFEDVSSIDMAAVENATTFSKVTYAVTSPMYSYLTSYKVDGKTTTLKKDLPVSASVCADVYSVFSGFAYSDASGTETSSSALDSIDIDTLKKAVRTLDDTVVGRSAVAFIFRELAWAVDTGETFFGMDVSELVNGDGTEAKLAAVIVEKFRYTTADTVSEDIYGFVSAVEVVRKVAKVTSIPDSKSPDFEKETENIVREIIEEITPESAEIITSVIDALSDDIAQTDDASKTVLSFATDILSGIGKAKADPNISAEETENTIEAMTKIVVSMFGEEKTDTDSVVEIIKSCAKSETIMSAIEKAATDGGTDIFGLSSYIEENREEAEEVLSLIESEFSGYDVENIKKLFGLN